MTTAPAPSADATTRRTDLLNAVKGIEAFGSEQARDIADMFNFVLRRTGGDVEQATGAAIVRLRQLLAETDLPREDRHDEYLRVVRAVYAPYRAEEAARMTRTRTEAVRRFRESAAWEQAGQRERDSDWELAAALLVFVVLAAILGLGMQVKNAALDAGAQAQEVRTR